MRANALSEVDGAIGLLNLGTCVRKMFSGKIIYCLEFLLVDLCSWLILYIFCYKLERSSRRGDEDYCDGARKTIGA